MNDEFLVLFAWITDMLRENPVGDVFAEGSEEHEILTAFREGWGARDTAQLLRGLTAAYGEKAGQAVENYMASVIRKDWAQTGKREAHEGTEIEDFIRLLWDPLKGQGFSFTFARASGRTTFHVTKCPIYELAERTGLHDWLYHLACATDFHTPGAFCPKIGFARTKTLMRGDAYCDHQYFYKDTQ
jgi:predicted ArsR family transcriptional regulator